MIIHHAEPCISCEHYSSDDRDDNHWVCGFNHDTCPHIEELHKAVGYRERINVEVLEKIRAEIKEKCDSEATNHDSFDDYSEGRYDAYSDCLRIVDKHVGGDAE